jgi:hypothetical protein
MTKQVNVTSLPAESGWSAPNNWTLNGGTEKKTKNKINQELLFIQPMIRWSTWKK